MPDINETVELPRDIPTEYAYKDKKLKELSKCSTVLGEKKPDKISLDDMKRELKKLLEEANG